MQVTQVEVRPESQAKEKPAKVSKSSFNDSEYKRWSENLRKRSRSKDK